MGSPHCRLTLSIRFLLVFAPLVVLFSPTPAARAAQKTENVFFITIDGMRWQEIFGGANRTLVDTSAGGVRAPVPLKKEFWRDTPEDRRQALMPFLWTTIAKQGQIFGDAAAGSPAQVTNGLKFSYPGYSEMLCGFADERINSNNRVLNPNANVLEWLSARPAFKDKVAAYGTWDRLQFILNVERSHLPMQSGWDAIADEPLSPVEREINSWLPELPHIWDDNAFDAIAGRAAMEYINKHHPRVFYLMFGETDEWAHLRRYDCYLEAANKNDHFIAKLWETLQTIPQYAGKTSLVITTDHGRGATAKDWTDHGKDTIGAEFVWMAVLGPDTPALGIRKDTPATQSQIGATLAALLGEDYHAAVPRAAGPLPGAVGGE